MKTPPTLKQIEFRQRLITFILPGILMLLSVIVLSVGITITNNVVKNRRELQTLKQTNSDSAAFKQFVTQNQSNLVTVNQVIPNEVMMIGVIQDFESVITKFDPSGVVEIASTTPTKIGVYSAITLNIKVATPLENVPNLLDSINRLPYMTQLITSESNLAGDSYRHQLTVRLYVQDPFNTPQ